MFKNRYLLPLLTFLAFILAFQSAYAMGSRYPAVFPAMEVKSMKVYHDFTMRGANSTIHVLADEWEQLPEGDTSLPDADADVDMSLCDGAGDSNSTDALLRRTDAFLDVMHIYTSLMNGYPKVLTEAQKQVIRRTPRCAPYTTFLEFIAKNLEDQGTPEQRLRLVRAQPQQIKDIILGNNSRNGYVKINMVSGETAIFSIPERVPESTDGVPYSFSGNEVAASQTGQNIGLRVDIADFRSVGDGNTYTSQESCTTTERTTYCHNGRCEDVYVTHYGYRTVTHRSNPEYVDYKLSVKNASGALMAEVLFEVFDPNSSPDTNGPCIAQGVDNGPRF